ncbi:MAG: hypothetical protein K2X03_19910 [Bryobacteraceae bacterium]|nr:hypothetical protein [Bryobacteraceae bacterium]
MRGWWGYYRLTEHRRPIFALEPWIRRHIRKCSQRWRKARGPSQTAEDRAQYSRRVPYGPSLAPCPVERSPPPLRLPHGIRSCGDLTPPGSTAGCGNRMSGGVGGWPGLQILVTRPDSRFRCSSEARDIFCASLSRRGLRGREQETSQR